MKKPIFLGVIAVVVSTALLRAVPYTPLVHHGNSSNRVDLVIMGDGYTSTDLGNGLFARDAARAVADIFSREPYQEYEPYFNVWRIDVESPESGADHPYAGIYRATTLDASYDCGGGATDICVHWSKMRAIVESTVPQADMVLVLVNDPRYGYSANEFATNPWYVSSNNPANLPQLLAGSSDAIIRRLYTFVQPIDSLLVPQTVLLSGERMALPYVQLVKPATHSLSVEWQVDGVTVTSDGSRLDTSKVPAGQHVLSAVVSDVTTMINGGVLRMTRNQTFSVLQRGSFSVTPSDLDGDGRSDLAVFNRRSGGFVIEGGRQFAWGTTGDIPVPADYDGDRQIDLAVYKPSSGLWYIPGQPPVQLGAPGDIPAPMDSGMDRVTGRAEPRIWRLDRYNMWLYSTSGYRGTSLIKGAVPLLPWSPDSNFSRGEWLPWRAQFLPNLPSGGYVGLPGDVPVPGNFIGGPHPDYAVFRPSTGVWYLGEYVEPSASVGVVLGYKFGEPGDIPVVLDRDGDGRAELGVYRGGTWHFWNLVTGRAETAQLGGPGDMPVGAPTHWLNARVIGDGDGDRRADLAVFRPSTTQWLISRSSGTRGVEPGCTFSASYCNPTESFPKSTTVDWGLSTDVTVGADYDGDHRLDPAVFRPSDGTWRILNSASEYTTATTTEWGLHGDIALPADYDADGKNDVAVFRPSTGRWYVRLSAGGTIVRDWGLNGDEPVPADYNGDGRADLAVFRPTTGLWYILDRFNNTYETRQWGLAGDVAVAADYDGDLKADEAVFRPSEGRWYVRLSGNGKYAISDWGVAGDVPQAADYDGDGRADVAVFRPSTGRWYVMNVLTADWGLPGDVPVTRGR